MSGVVTQSACQGCVNGLIEELHRRINWWVERQVVGSGQGLQQPDLFRLFIEATLHGTRVIAPAGTTSIEVSAKYKPGRDFTECCSPLPQKGPEGTGERRYEYCQRSRTPIAGRRECHPRLVPRRRSPL